MKSDVRIGFDIGASHIRAVVSRGGRVRRIPISETPASKKQCARTIKAIIAREVSAGDVGIVGISIAGVLSGTILRVSPNKSSLTGLDLKKAIPSGFLLRVDNDARAFALGEYAVGAGKGAKRLLALTFGTGVGRGFVHNGKLQAVRRFEYPEIWERQYQRLRDIKKDKVFADFIVEKLAPILARYQPDRIVIGGGVALDKKTRFFLVVKKSFALHYPRIDVRRAKLGEYAGAIGMLLA